MRCIGIEITAAVAVVCYSGVRTTAVAVVQFSCNTTGSYAMVVAGENERLIEVRGSCLAVSEPACQTMN